MASVEPKISTIGISIAAEPRIDISIDNATSCSQAYGTPKDCIEKAVFCHEKAMWGDALYWLDVMQSHAGEEDQYSVLMRARRSLIEMDLGRLDDAVAWGEKAVYLLCHIQRLANGSNLSAAMRCCTWVWASIAIALKNRTPAEPNLIALGNSTRPKLSMEAWMRLVPAMKVWSLADTKELPKGLSVLLEALQHPSSKQLRLALAVMAATPIKELGKECAWHWYWLGEAFKFVEFHRSSLNCFHKAILLAKQNGQAALEFRAKIALARLLYKSGHDIEASELFWDTSYSMLMERASTATSISISMEEFSHHERSTVVKSGTGKGRRTDDYIERASRVLAQSKNVNIKVSDLALQCAVSRRTLEKVILRQLGITALRFIGQARLERIKQLISEGISESSQIASTLEYTSIAAMRRDVRRLSGNSILELIRRKKETRPH
jgi:AraC-like DNA-binding protein